MTKSTANATPDKARNRCHDRGNTSVDGSDIVRRSRGDVRVRPREDRSITPEPPDRRIDPQRKFPHELGGHEKTRRAVRVPPLEEFSQAPDQEKRPANQTQPRQAARDE